MTWEDILALARDRYPGLEPALSYGTPCLRLRGKFFTRLRPQDDSLVLLEVEEDEKRMLIEVDPKLFHTTPHYNGYPAVLARLAHLTPEQVRPYFDRRYRRLVGRKMLAEWEHG